MPLPFFTIGHSTRSIEEFVTLLRAAQIQRVVDIRSVPRSRTNPQYNKDVLAENLAPYQISYRHVAELGGLRGKAKAIPADVNGMWQNKSFHNYADYALSDSFHDGLEMLVQWGRQQHCAMMCSEAVWWRCHRRIVADYLLARGETVYHLMGNDKQLPASLTKGAVVTSAQQVVYPAAPE